jgi:hypothetical protein
MNGRTWSMDINGEPYIEPQFGLRMFRVVFDIQISPGDALSLADIRIYNLLKTTAIQQGSSIVFRGGFEDASDTLFIGYVTNVLRERDPGSAEIVTRLICKSGDPVKDRGSAQGSYGKGTKIVDVLRDLARSWPIQLDVDEGQFADSPLLVSGYNTNGDIPTILFDLGYAYGFDWVQERGRLVVTRRNFPRTVTPTLVNQFTGMQGIPEVTGGPNGLGVFVSVRMNPYFRVNGRITLQSEFATYNTGNLYVVELAGDATANGDWNIFALRQRGDSHGNLWTTEIDGIRAGAVAPAPGSIPNSVDATGVLVWGARVAQDFRVRVRQMGDNLNINPDWLMAVMGFETGYTFDPTTSNPGSSATGLIQFLETTARGLGTTTTALRRMTAVQQLDYVEKYFAQYASRITNLGDCYMAVLWPVAMGRPDSYVMWTKVGTYAAQYAANAGLDVNRDDQITRGEAVARVNTSLMRGQQFAR